MLLHHGWPYFVRNCNGNYSLITIYVEHNESKCIHCLDNFITNCVQIEATCEVESLS